MKGIVSDAVTGRPVSNAVIHVKNITRVNRSGARKDDDINHDVTSVHDGDYWRLLTPGEYEITAFKEGFEPQTKLFEVSYTVMVSRGSAHWIFRCTMHML